MSEQGVLGVWLIGSMVCLSIMVCDGGIGCVGGMVCFRLMVCDWGIVCT